MVGPDGKFIQRPDSAQRMTGEVGDHAYTIDLPGAGAEARGMEFDEGLVRESQVETIGDHVYSWKLLKLQAPGSAAMNVPGQFPVKIFLQKKDLDGKLVAEEEVAEWVHDSGAVIDKRRIFSQIKFSDDLETKLDRLDVITLPHDLKGKVEFILNNDGVLMGTLASRIGIGELPDYFLAKAFTPETVASYQKTKDFHRLVDGSAAAAEYEKKMLAQGDAGKKELLSDLLKQGRFFLAAGTVEEAAQLDASSASDLSVSQKIASQRSASAWNSVVGSGFVSGAGYIYNHLSTASDLDIANGQMTFLGGTITSLVTGSLHDYFAKRGWIKGGLRSSRISYLVGGVLGSCLCECMIRLLR